MPDFQKLITNLRSHRSSTRYEACEELRVAPVIPPEALSALRAMTNDPDPGVADAARRALATHSPPPPPALDHDLPSPLPENLEVEPPFYTTPSERQPFLFFTFTFAPVMRWFRTLLADTWNGPRSIALALASAGPGAASSMSALLAARLLVLALLWPVLGALLLLVSTALTGVAFESLAGLWSILSIPSALAIFVLGPLASLVGVAFGALAIFYRGATTRPSSSGLVPSVAMLLFFGALILGAVILT